MMGDENLNRSDWISVLQPFEEHNQLKPRRHPDQGIRGLLTIYDSGIEGEVFYRVKNTSGDFEMWFSTKHREEDAELLHGHLSYNGEIAGNLLQEKYREIADTHATKYLQPKETDREGELAKVRIPEDYDPETLNETIQAGVNMIQETEKLHSRLKDTLSEYSSSH